MKLYTTLRNPFIWFAIGFVLLATVHQGRIVNSVWFAELPKAVGDGLDYENLGFHLWRREGFVIDTGDTLWRAPYEAEAQYGVYAQHLDVPPRNLLATGRPPLFPAMIAGVYWVLGRTPAGFAAVRLLLVACLAFAGGLAVMVSVRLLGKYSTWTIAVGGMVTLGLAASNRTLLGYCTDFLTEPLALLLTQGLITVAVFYVTRDRVSAPAPSGSDRSGWTFVLMGLLLGGMILTRSMFVLWIPPLAIIAAASSDGALKTRVYHAGLVVGVACLVCLPWWIRNVGVLGEWMPLGTQGKIALLGGYCDTALEHGGEWQFEPEQRLRAELLGQPEFRSANDTRREVLVARAAGARVSEWIAEHTFDLPRLVAARVVTHWNPYSGRSLLWRLGILAGALLLILRRERAALWLVGLPVVSTCVVAVLYTTGGRFLVPLYGALFSLAGIAVGSLADMFSQATWESAPREGEKT